MKESMGSKFLIAALFMLFSCVGEYPVELPFSDPELVVDATIHSIARDSYITIGWTFRPGEGCNEGSGYGVCAPDTVDTGEPYRVTGTVVIEEESGEVHTYPMQMHDRKGFTYIALGFGGSPGERYTLTIEVMYDNETRRYTAATRMLETPPIDAMDFEIREGDIGKDDEFVPLISFREPQDEKNFYLFKLCESYSESYRFCSSSSVWHYSVISDEFLPENVSGLSIDDGGSVVRYTQFYPPLYEDVGARVFMFSVERETYEFYKALLDQFDNDGGTFSSQPSMVHGNISGGGFGIFKAIDESTGVVYLNPQLHNW